MARIRAIKPSAFTSESLANVSVSARWTFAGLWTYVDDEGRGKADPRLIKGQIWPLDDDVTPKDVAGYLDELEDEGCICRYESGGREYLHVVHWQHQTISKPTPSRLPECPWDPHDDPGDSPESAGGAHDDSGESPLGTGNKEEEEEEEGNRDGPPGKPGGGRPKSLAARQREAAPIFAEWYALYPRKKKRPDALRAYVKAIDKISHAELMERTRSYAASVARSDPNYVPYPATWLNAEQWADEPDPEPPPKQTPSESAIDHLDSLKDDEPPFPDQPQLPAVPGGF